MVFFFAFVQPPPLCSFLLIPPSFPLLSSPLLPPNNETDNGRRRARRRRPLRRDYLRDLGPADKFFSRFLAAGTPRLCRRRPRFHRRCFALLLVLPRRRRHKARGCPRGLAPL